MCIGENHRIVLECYIQLQQQQPQQHLLDDKHYKGFYIGHVYCENRIKVTIKERKDFNTNEHKNGQWAFKGLSIE